MDDVTQLLADNKIRDTIVCNWCKKEITRSVIARHKRSKACTIQRLEIELGVWDKVIAIENQKFQTIIDDLRLRKRAVQQELDKLTKG